MGAKKIKPVRTNKHMLPSDMDFSESLRYWLEMYSRHLIAGLVGVVIVVMSIWGYQLYNRNKEMRAHEAYGIVLNAWPWESPENGNWELFIVQATDFLHEHDNTKAALQARLDLARAHFALGEYEEAYERGMEVAEKLRDRHPMRPLADYQLALIARQLGKFGEAVAHWQSLEKTGGPRMAREVHWQIARIHLHEQNLEKAVEHYRRALDSAGDYPREELIRQELASAQARVVAES